MQQRSLTVNGPTVSALGLGCMGMTPLYGTPDPEEAVRTVQAAIDAGVTLVDTSDAYAGGKNEELVGRAIAGRRDKIVLATKFGNIRNPDGSSTVNGKPDYVMQACEASLKRLGVETIDLYYVHRIDPTVPIEDTVGAMVKLVEAGKVRFIGLSEAGVETIARAYAAHPITALQTEYSLGTRLVEDEILPKCRELGIGFVAYSPLGRGLLTGKIHSLDELSESDRRRAMPRFQTENLAHNLARVDTINDIAEARGVSGAVVALAWVLAQGDDIVPIPGCSRRESLSDTLSALDFKLSADELARLSETFVPGAVIGDRYPPGQMKRLGL